MFDFFIEEKNLKRKGTFFWILVFGMTTMVGLFSSQPDSVHERIAATGATPDACQELQDIFHGALKAFGLPSCGVVKNDPKHAGCLVSDSDGMMYLSVDEKVLLEIDDKQELTFLMYFYTSMAKILCALNKKIKARGVLFSMSKITQALFALHALLEQEATSVVDCFFLMRVKNIYFQVPSFGSIEQEEVVFRYAMAFREAYAQSLKPSVIEFIQRYLDELKTGTKQFKCALAVESNGKYFVIEAEDGVSLGISSLNLQELGIVGDAKFFDFSQDFQPDPASVEIDSVASFLNNCFD
jgi:hypothetical protein